MIRDIIASLLLQQSWISLLLRNYPLFEAGEPQGALGLAAPAQHPLVWSVFFLVVLREDDPCLLSNNTHVGVFIARSRCVDYLSVIHI